MAKIKNVLIEAFRVNIDCVSMDNVTDSFLPLSRSATKTSFTVVFGSAYLPSNESALDVSAGRRAWSSSRQAALAINSFAESKKIVEISQSIAVKSSPISISGLAFCEDSLNSCPTARSSGQETTDDAVSDLGSSDPWKEVLKYAILPLSLIVTCCLSCCVIGLCHLLLLDGLESEAKGQRPVGLPHLRSYKVHDTGTERSTSYDSKDPGSGAESGRSSSVRFADQPEFWGKDEAQMRNEWRDEFRRMYSGEESSPYLPQVRLYSSNPVSGFQTYRDLAESAKTSFASHGSVKGKSTYSSVQGGYALGQVNYKIQREREIAATNPFFNKVSKSMTPRGKPSNLPAWRQAMLAERRSGTLSDIAAEVADFGARQEVTPMGRGLVMGIGPGAKLMTPPFLGTTVGSRELSQSYSQVGIPTFAGGAGVSPSSITSKASSKGGPTHTESIALSRSISMSRSGSSSQWGIGDMYKQLEKTSLSSSSDLSSSSFESSGDRGLERRRGDRGGDRGLGPGDVQQEGATGAQAKPSASRVTLSVREGGDRQSPVKPSDEGSTGGLFRMRERVMSIFGSRRSSIVSEVTPSSSATAAGDTSALTGVTAAGTSTSSTDRHALDATEFADMGTMTDVSAPTEHAVDAGIDTHSQMTGHKRMYSRALLSSRSSLSSSYEPSPISESKSDHSWQSSRSGRSRSSSASMQADNAMDENRSGSMLSGLVLSDGEDEHDISSSSDSDPPSPLALKGSPLSPLVTRSRKFLPTGSFAPSTSVEVQQAQKAASRAVEEAREAVQAAVSARSASASPVMRGPTGIELRSPLSVPMPPSQGGSPPEMSSAWLPSRLSSPQMLQSPNTSPAQGFSDPRKEHERVLVKEGPRRAQGGAAHGSLEEIQPVLSPGTDSDREGSPQYRKSGRNNGATGGSIGAELSPASKLPGILDASTLRSPWREENDVDAGMEESKVSRDRTPEKEVPVERGITIEVFFSSSEEEETPQRRGRVAPTPVVVAEDEGDQVAEHDATERALGVLDLMQVMGNFSDSGDSGADSEKEATTPQLREGSNLPFEVSSSLSMEALTLSASGELSVDVDVHLSASDNSREYSESEDEQPDTPDGLKGESLIP
ncbi:unnamed protein product [Choristocarpus tenellus]